MEAVTQAEWLNLVGCAIAGTGKRAPASSGDDREGGALALAAMLGAGLRAGAKSSVAPSPILAARADSCPRPAHSYTLRRCLDLSSDMVVAWLEEAAEAGLGVPTDCLVEILAFGAKGPRERDLVRKTIGERGVWLAPLNPEWAYAGQARESDEDVWQLGTATDRLIALRRLANEDPSRAIALAKETFVAEAADFRASILETIDRWTGEEGFLLPLLLDRSLAVREQAVRALARLPDSAVAKAAADIASPLLRIHKGLLRRSAEIALPPIEEAPKKSPESWLQRFAFVWPKPLGGMGWRESLLTRIVGLVRPREWTRATGLTPEDLIALTAKDPHGPAWLEGLALATELHQDPSWIDPLIGSKNISPGRMARVLPERERDRLLARLVPKGDDMNLAASLELRRWSPELSRSVLRYLTSHLRNPLTYIGVDVRSVAIRLHPDTHREALAMIDDKTERALEQWRELLPLLDEMRREMARAKE